MKKNFSTIIAIIVCILLAANMVQINSLKQEVSRLRSRLNKEINTMNDNISGIYGDVQHISGIYGDVQDMLEEESNQLAVSNWQYGEIDVDARTAEVICTVVPKLYTPDTTLASIVCNGQKWALTYNEGQYVATIELPLFDRSEFAQVELNDNGTIRTQELDWVIEPRYEALLLSYAGMGGSATGKKGENEYIWSVEYSVHINVVREGTFEIKSVEFVEILDGKEINRIPIDISDAGQQAYAEQVSKKGKAVPEHINEIGKYKGTGYEGSVDFLYFLDKDYHIPNGSMIEFYVDVVDGNGLCYRSFVKCYAVTADGEPDELRMEEKQRYSFAEPVLILDEAGNVLYKIDSSLFQ